MHFVREIVFSNNQAGVGTTIPGLNAFLKKENIANYSDSTLLRHMHGAGFVFGHGHLRMTVAESPSAVAFRNRYLRHIMENRTDNGLLVYPLVVIDESYAHFKLRQLTTWFFRGRDASLKEQDFLAQRSSGKMACILGAGVYENKGNEVVGHLVSGCLEVWDRDSTGRPVGRPPAEGYTVDDEKETYHGNVDAQLFEGWFHDLCVRLQKAYSQCLIIMDGAASHKRRIDPPPSVNEKKAKQVEWLVAHGVQTDASLTKAELVEQVNENKGVTSYVVVGIAKELNHKVLFTPPYHPELQPIEKIWEVAKNYLRAYPVETPMMLIDAVRNALCYHTGTAAWAGARKSVLKWEDEYWTRSEKEEMIDSDDDDDKMGVSKDSEMMS